MARFFRDCPTCYATGEVSAGHSQASTFQNSGEILIDEGRSYCGDCHGAGVKLKSSASSPLEHRW